MTKYYFFIFTALFFLSCSPQAFVFNVDKNNNAEEVLLSSTSTSIFTLLEDEHSTKDSIISSNLSIGIARKVETDKVLPPESIGKYIIKKKDLENKNFNLAKSTLVVDNFKFGTPEKVVYENLRYEDYVPTYILLPYSVDFKVFDAIKNEFIYSKTEIDTVRLETLNSNFNKSKIESIVDSKLPDICTLIGERISAKLSPQWENQSKMLITFEGSDKWQKPCLLAKDFKLKQAIDLWLPITSSPNNKKASFAAYNISVCCDIIGNKVLAKTWINFALQKYKFKEAIEMQEQLTKE